MDHDSIMEVIAETIVERSNAIHATAKSSQDYERAEFGLGFTIIEVKENTEK